MLREGISSLRGVQSFLIDCGRDMRDAGTGNADIVGTSVDGRESTISTDRSAFESFDRISVTVTMYRKGSPNPHVDAPSGSHPLGAAIVCVVPDDGVWCLHRQEVYEALQRSLQVTHRVRSGSSRMRVELKAAIAASGYPAYAIGKRAGIGESRLSRIVRGRVRPRKEEVVALCRVLAMPPHTLFERESCGT